MSGTQVGRDCARKKSRLLSECSRLSYLHRQPRAAFFILSGAGSEFLSDSVRGFCDFVVAKFFTNSERQIFLHCDTYSIILQSSSVTYEFELPADRSVRKPNQQL